MKSSVLFIIPIFVLVLSLSFISCQKDTDCAAVITCQDSLGRFVGSANVFLYAKVKNASGVTYTADVTANATTDNAGQASFTFKLPAIYDIQATKVVGTKTLTGIGIIQLEEGSTVNKTVTMR